jgi:integrase
VGRADGGSPKINLTAGSVGARALYQTSDKKKRGRAEVLPLGLSPIGDKPLTPLAPSHFRAGSSTRLGEAGYDAYEIRKLMGHSSITTTRIYVHPRAMRLREAVEAVSRGRGHSADTRKTGTGG